MARDLEQGIDVEKKYPPRAQFCIPVLVTLRGEIYTDHVYNFKKM